MTLDLFFLMILLLSAVWTVMTTRLIRSVVGLAITSAVLSVIMYRLAAPLAAVFELSVCSGLISVIFIITVSFTQRLTKETFGVRRKKLFAKFLYLPFIIIAAGLLLNHFLKIPPIDLPAAYSGPDVRGLLWNLRHMDLLGQAVVLLTGVLGVVILFKESNK